MRFVPVLLILLATTGCVIGLRKVWTFDADGNEVSQREIYSPWRESRRQAEQDWWDKTFRQPMYQVMVEDFALTNASLEHAIARLNDIMSTAATNGFPPFVVEGDVPARPLTFHTSRSTADELYKIITSWWSLRLDHRTYEDPTVWKLRRP